MKYLILFSTMIFSSIVNASETTVYGKIVGIETRAWGLHVQTDFGGGSAIGCPVVPGQTYMFDFEVSGANRTGENAEFTQSLLLAAFASGAEVSFHLYSCRGSRPRIGYVRVKQ